jgi:diaminohydroxyphosphoribosylaminopyrimidine deaminase/5-amino-6-(5-phosphoribosylamino)uracil reductase
MNALYQLNIQSVLVEGGAQLLQSFIDESMWDEARVIRNENLFIHGGIASPVLEQYVLIRSQTISSDTLKTFHPLK